MIRILLLILASLVTHPGDAADSPPTLDEHLQRISAEINHQVRFTEEHHGSLFDAPLIYTGQLNYRAEDRALVKQVNTPESARMTVTERAILVESGGRSRRLSLGSRPELRALLGSFRALIEGDSELLQNRFDTRLRPLADDRWELTLSPRNKRLARHVEAIIIDGQGSLVTGFCTRMANGDWQHLMLIHDD